jgi:hypothetical protein
MNVGRRRGCGGRVTLGGNGVGSSCRTADLYPFREGGFSDLTGSGQAEFARGKPSSAGGSHRAVGL